MWDHVQERHGPKYFPWVCGCCYEEDIKYYCYVKPEDLVEHGKRFHPNVMSAKDLVHKDYGNDYTSFPYQTLQF